MIQKKSFALVAMTSVVFVFLSIQLTFGQNYKDIFKSKYRVSIDSARLYSKQLIQSNQPHQKAFGLVFNGYLLAKQTDYEEAEQFYLEGFREIEKIKNESLRTKAKFGAYYYYSSYFLMQHELKKANQYINQGLDLSRSQNNLEEQIQFRDLLVRSLSLAKLYEDAFKIFIEMIALKKQLEPLVPSDVYKDDLVRLHLNTINTTMAAYLNDSVNNKSYLDTTTYFFKEIEKIKVNHNFSLGDVRRRQFSHLKADLEFFRKNYNKSIELYNEVIVLSEKLGAKKRVFQIKYQLGKIYFLMGEYLKAKNVFDEISEEDLKRYKLLKNNVDIKYYYARIHKELGNIEEALQYTEAYSLALEGYYKMMSETKIDANNQREFNEKKQILDELEDEIKRNQNLNTYILYLIIVFLILIVFVIGYSKQKQKKLEAKIQSILMDIDDTKVKEITHSKIDESKARDILEKLRKIESQELFLSQDYSLNMLAKKVGSNSSYVSKIINTHLNKSFVEYTNELRINYILVKLKEDSMYQKFTLTAISESVGYKSVNSFNKHFKSIAGVTPKQYLDYINKMAS